MITKNPKHRARLMAAHQDFIRRTKGLEGAVLRHRLTAIVNRAPGVGVGMEDPFVQALAKQALQALEIEDRIGSAQRELEEIKRQPADGYYPRQPNRKAEMALRREELEKNIHNEQGRLLLLAQDRMERAQREAIAAYEYAEATAARHAKVRERVEAKRATREDAEIDAAAELVLAGSDVSRGE